MCKEYKNYFKIVNQESDNMELCIKVKSRYILNKKEYIDADAKSRELYEDLKILYFNERENKEFLKSRGLDVNDITIDKSGGNYHLKYGEFKLSSDYIGPSITWGRNAKLENEELLKMLEISRTLGGHILFPKGINVRQHTVNQARGGRPYYDRLDLTLWAIKKWYERNDSGSKIEAAITRYGKWFELFVDSDEKNGFRNFIKFHKLEAWVNDEYQIYNLVESNFEKNYRKILVDEEIINLEKEGTEIYRRYISNVNELIKLRTKKIVETLDYKVGYINNKS